MSKDVVFYLLIKTSPTSAFSIAIGSSPPQDCVNRLHEITHSVVSGSARSIQPINISIFARDEAISAGSDVDDNLSLVHVENAISLSEVYMAAR
jgi:hypothetical protein